MSLLSQVSTASTSDTPEARAYIERFRGEFSFDREQEIITLYSRILAGTKHDDSVLQTVRDVAYGHDERNRLDVHYRKGSERESHATVIFIHGGGFVSGDKIMSQQIYDNVANYFARRGLVAINATYRLAPAHQWPSGMEDVERMLRWAHSHVSAYGGDSERIFLMGQSAGAAHVASFVFSTRNIGNQGLAGAILLSGDYSAALKEDAAYYGTDKRLRAQQSVLDQISGHRVPTLLMYAEYDPLSLQIPSIELARKLCDRDLHCPNLSVMSGHNHMSMIFHFDTADESGASDILAFIRRQEMLLNASAGVQASLAGRP